MTTTTAVSIRGLARALGVSEHVARKGVDSGRLQKSIGQDDKGHAVCVDINLAKREWRDNADPAKGSGKQPATVAEERNRLLRAQASKTEMQVRKIGGQLIDAARAKARAFEIARTVRDRMLNIPDRVAHELAGETDAAKIHARIDAEIRTALEALVEELT